MKTCVFKCFWHRTKPMPRPMPNNSKLGQTTCSALGRAHYKDLPRRTLQLFRISLELRVSHKVSFFFFFLFLRGFHHHWVCFLHNKKQIPQNQRKEQCRELISTQGKKKKKRKRTQPSITFWVPLIARNPRTQQCKNAPETRQRYAAKDLAAFPQLPWT